MESRRPASIRGPCPAPMSVAPSRASLRARPPRKGTERYALPMASRWREMHAPEDVVARVLATDRSGHTTGARLAAAPDDPGGAIIACSEDLTGAEPADVDGTILQAARLFKLARAAVTERLGPGTQVEVDEETWTPSGLPEAVLEAALCTMSLLVAWPMAADGWCVLEVHQETEEQPVMVLLYRVAAA